MIHGAIRTVCVVDFQRVCSAIRWPKSRWKSTGNQKQSTSALGIARHLTAARKGILQRELISDFVHAERGLKRRVS